MATTATTPPASTAAPPDLVPAPAHPIPRPLRHPVGLATLSGGLLWLTFPPVEWHGAAWVVLVPLFLLVLDPTRRWWPGFATGLGGFAFWLLAVQWVLAVDPSAWVGWLAMAFALALFWVGFVWSTRAVIRRWGWPLTVVAPVAWVGFEYLRAHVLTGFPWYYLAHTQFRQLHWTQISDLTGSLGVSFLVALVNAAVAENLAPWFYRGAASSPLGSFRPGETIRPTRGRWVRLAIVGACLGVSLAYGAYRLGTAEFRPGPRMALLQSGEVQEYNPEKRKSSADLHRLYLDLLDIAARRTPKPDLVVWPETAYPYGAVSISPGITGSVFASLVERYNARYGSEMIAADWLRKHEANQREIGRLLAQYRIPLMLGATTYAFRPDGVGRYNSAILFPAEGEPQSYHKVHLVPFGEYVPLVETLPVLLWLTPYGAESMPTLDFGPGPAWFTLGSFRLAAAICFEDTVPHVVRRAFGDKPSGTADPDLIVNLSNDGWFHETSEHLMHLAVATFRCVENRAPMVRAVNTGISAVVDGNGRIVAQLAQTAVGVLDATVPLDDRTALYSRGGDWLGMTCLALAVTLGLVARLAPRRWRRGPPEPRASA